MVDNVLQKRGQWGDVVEPAGYRSRFLAGLVRLRLRVRPRPSGRGSVVVKVRGRHVTTSNPVPLKTRRVGERCTLNLSRAQTSTRWCGVIVRRGACQLRCRPRYLTMVQNDEVHRQKPLCS
ncbi:uncharacterized protein TNCV_1166491 [Trichonephila clavipes]|uniref:Uncharacterized protein n=1 Tax=Trichonephila clavipes TaxID=2585209 RepID=A0A8X6T6M5_TRICX|nr:uncharacterized protein TNCV_1166491 [Trichonephila clavipes]